MSSVVAGNIISIESQTDNLGIGRQVSGTLVHVTLGEVGGGHEILGLELQHALFGLVIGIVLDVLINVHVNRQGKKQGVINGLRHIHCSDVDFSVGNSTTCDNHRKS